MEMLTGAAIVETAVEVLQKSLYVGLWHDPAVSPWGIDPSSSISYSRDICSSMFIAFLFLMDTVGSLDGYLINRKWKVWHIYILKYYWADKIKEIYR